MRYSNFKLALTGVVVLTLAQFASADVNWAGTTGNWNVASNWDTGVPGSADYAYIENGGTAIVSDAQTAKGAFIGYAVGTTGTVEIVSGGTLTGVGGWNQIARYDGSKATLIVNGGTFITGGYLRSAGTHAGSATITVNNGGTITSANSIALGYAGGTGAITIDGSGSAVSVTGGDGDVHVGRYGHVTLDISNGGLLDTVDDGFVGGGSGGSGAVTVTGAGSTWKLGDILYVGRDGAGTLNIVDGGLVQAGRLSTDYDGANDDGVVRMAGSGMLAIADGGTAATDLNAFLGLLTGGTDNILYWNGSAWDDIQNATQGTDYVLDQYSDGGTSYSRLTVSSKVSLLIISPLQVK